MRGGVELILQYGIVPGNSEVENIRATHGLAGRVQTARCRSKSAAAPAPARYARAKWTLRAAAAGGYQGTDAAKTLSEVTVRERLAAEQVPARGGRTSWCSPAGFMKRLTCKNPARKQSGRVTAGDEAGHGLRVRDEGRP